MDRSVLVTFTVCDEASARLMRIARQLARMVDRPRRIKRMHTLYAARRR